MTKNPKPFFPFKNVFIASDPDNLKSFNDNLSKKIIEKMQEAFDSHLSKGEFEKYVETVNQMITQLFPTNNKVTIQDVVNNPKLADSLKEISNCSVLSNSSKTDQNGIPVLDIFFPQPNSSEDAKCEFGQYIFNEAPNVLDDGSYVFSNLNQFFARTLFGNPAQKGLACDVANVAPPQNINYDLNLTSDQTYSYNQYKCTSPAFLQNFIATIDQISANVGGRPHFVYNTIQAHNSSKFPHYIGFDKADSESEASGYVQVIDEKWMMHLQSELGYGTGANLHIVTHETLHWLGMGHPHEVEVTRKFLEEWSVKNGDPSPSVASYGGDYLFKETLNVPTFDHRVRNDDRFAYLRPYDVLFLEQKRHEKLLCMDQRKELGLVVDQSSLSRSAGQQCAFDNYQELKNHSFDTLSESSQRILAHSLKRVMCIEVPVMLASEAIIQCFGGRDSDNQQNLDEGEGNPDTRGRIQKFITSENGIAATKNLLRTLCNIVAMGVNPTVASFALQTGVQVAAGTFNLVAQKTGLDESEVAKRFKETSEYISEYVPEVIRKNLFGFAMIWALNNIQYSDYVDAFTKNWSIADSIYNSNGSLNDTKFIPTPSITTAESIITSCVVSLFCAALSTGLKMCLKKTDLRQNRVGVEEVDLELGEAGGSNSEQPEIIEEKKTDVETNEKSSSEVDNNPPENSSEVLEKNSEARSVLQSEEIESKKTDEESLPIGDLYKYKDSSEVLENNSETRSVLQSEEIESKKTDEESLPIVDLYQYKDSSEFYDNPEGLKSKVKTTSSEISKAKAEQINTNKNEILDRGDNF